MVRAQFRPLRDEIGGPEPVSASTSTGRRNTREQVALVQALAPAAIETVERLIADEEQQRDNGGPPNVIVMRRSRISGLSIGGSAT